MYSPEGVYPKTIGRPLLRLVLCFVGFLKTCSTSSMSKVLYQDTTPGARRQYSEFGKIGDSAWHL